VGAEGGAPQVPRVFPVAIVQVPEQQSVDLAQTSEGWMQKEEPSWQTPPPQRPEQHSVPALHALPAVWQAVLRGVHFPAVHEPPQQLASVVQARLSAMQAVVAHFPATQLNPQHSVDVPHAAVAGAQAPTLAAQEWVVASHSCEQQSAPVWQTSANL
jgi:hypothetical protein